MLLLSLPAPGGWRLFAAIRQVESAGDDFAVGDDGCSRGPYQITRAYWTDARVPWPYDPYVWSARHCEVVMVRYWARYGARTDEQRARMHNGGPRGHRKRCALRYWRAVKLALETY